MKCFLLYIFLGLLKRCSAEIYAIKFESQFYFEEFGDIQAQFGPKLADGAVRGMLVNPEPPSACNKSLKPPPTNIVNEIGKWVLLVPRYTSELNCSFEEKVRIAQLAGYDAVIVYNINSEELVPMSAKNGTGINIPSVFVSYSSGEMLKNIYTDPKYFVVITGESPFNIQTHLLIPFAIVVGICFIVMITFMIVKFIKDRRRQRRHRLPTSTLNKIPTRKYQKGDPYETCAICLDDYAEGEKLRILPCNHVYHSKCIDPWLTKNRRVCPICKRKVFAHDEPQHDSDSDSDADDTTPLINSNNRGTQGGTFENQTENPLQRAARSISQQSGAATFVTASDHHSINGDYQSLNSSNSGSEDCLDRSLQEHICDSLEVHVHSVDTESNSSRGAVNV
ncbi:E3 ubiquitin-protein ligase RNF13-like isoform X1 [Anoplophora glabripennis]|uniref:E3 ubiquitin-protein ligase RNF13-like isoform X1 n=1 Tax=Anoplophora glabripennis TaxID=217634 RepID=UPI0008759768|nr:E3 ubiquitin-protein ligase RNF13-like isoform X1 [Anoplophora glabripennis]XP_018575696.1 E3 ubiquitin-protein ligase RNF13-like isoform X1 [Anoplophora glabripennis]XP_018575697.1 E3 ubiquitin-protein ligase RNF13-like isoform X1 [Anoplophora glabripennis]